MTLRRRRLYATHSHAHPSAAASRCLPLDPSIPRYFLPNRAGCSIRAASLHNPGVRDAEPHKTNLVGLLRVFRNIFEAKLLRGTETAMIEEADEVALTPIKLGSNALDPQRH